MTADTTLGPSISLFDADEQTVLDVDGGVVTASQVGPRFGVDAAAAAENAFDGDPSTAWSFGDFGRGLGQSVTVRPDRPVPVDRVLLDIPPTTGQRISRVEVRADDEVRDVRVPADGRVSVRFPGRMAGRITVTVTEVDGVGNNPLFVAEVAVPGLQVRACGAAAAVHRQPHPGPGRHRPGPPVQHSAGRRDDPGAGQGRAG